MSRAVAWTNDQLQRRGLSLDGRLENGPLMTAV